MLHIFVLFFFSLLLLYQLIFNTYKNDIIEGLDDSSNDPIIISKINASDIIVLKKQMDELSDINERVSDIETQISQNTKDINSIHMNDKGELIKDNS
jgi:hypothetical protein